MAKDKHICVKDRMIDSMLALAAAQPWDLVSLAEIAQKAEIPMAEAYEYFDDKGDVLSAYGRKLDRQILDAIVVDESLSCRERLFDLLMERFDALNENRTAIVNILSGFKGDPKEAVLSLPHLGKSMSRTMEAAGIDTAGITGAVKVAGLVGIYLYAVRSWKDDDSADMGKTMAALDKALERAESLYNSLPVK